MTLYLNIFFVFIKTLSSGINMGDTQFYSGINVWHLKKLLEVWEVSRWQYNITFLPTGISYVHVYIDTDYESDLCIQHYYTV